MIGSDLEPHFFMLLFDAFLHVQVYFVFLISLIALSRFFPSASNAAINFTL
uniref:Cell division control protein 31 n=1 Tax=virus sp. ctLl75 TaxID=2828249 RepID=A0A8S5RBG3_9VIRU|nr:MAG TPA: cell division control protein 31 [virus sp. ctLl75]DAN52390.1 MAG TPA: cell division control protein 31 [Caudoviricetes sp.]